MLACDTPEMAVARRPRARRRAGACRCSRSTGAAPSTASSRIRRWCGWWTTRRRAAGVPLQRTAHVGALTDLSYIQFHGPDRASPASTWASRCATRTRRPEVVDPADVEALVTPPGRGARPHHTRTWTSSARREPHARRRYRDVRVQGRPRGRERPGRRDRHPPAHDDRAAARAGPSTGPDEDWWGDLVAITRELLATSGVDPGAIDAVATSAIGPCMLPVDADGRAAHERASCTAWTPARAPRSRR